MPVQRHGFHNPNTKTVDRICSLNSEKEKNSNPPPRTLLVHCACFQCACNFLANPKKSSKCYCYGPGACVGTVSADALSSLGNGGSLLYGLPYFCLMYQTWRSIARGNRQLSDCCWSVLVCIGLTLLALQ